MDGETVTPSEGAETNGAATDDVRHENGSESSDHEMGDVMDVMDVMDVTGDVIGNGRTVAAVRTGVNGTVNGAEGRDD